jgi:dienelactone hydrolase
MTLVTAALVAAAAGCGGSGGGGQSQAEQPFAYDASQPLGFQDQGRANKKYPIAIDNVSYKSGKDRVPAYLLLPPANGKKKRPAVIYLHGSNGDRTTMIVPATWMAGRGAVGLTITAPSSRIPVTEGGSPTTELKKDVDLEERDVVAIRRAVDLLRSRPDVDPNRIGFVGWSAGARTGAILAGVEPRLRTLVLMSGGAVPVQVYTRRAPKKLKKTIGHYLHIVDPLHYLRQARGSTLLLQDGRDDQDVPRSALASFANAAPAGTTIRWYNADHPLNDAAYRDQLEWLAQKLGVTGPPVQGALTGPPS